MPLAQAATKAASGVIELQTPKRTVLAQPAEIVALRADVNFTRVHVANQPEVVIWRALAHVESLLPSPPFPRIGRSLIVNRNRLRNTEIQSRSSALVTLQGMSEPLILGRAAAPRLFEVLTEDKS